MTHMKQMLIATALVVATPAVVAAQAPALHIAPSASVLFHQVAVPETARPAPANVGGHGVTGAIVGGAVLGVGGAILGNGLCDSGGRCTSATIAGAAVGAVVGAVLGAFIGATID